MVQNVDLRESTLAVIEAESGRSSPFKEVEQKTFRFVNMF